MIRVARDIKAGCTLQRPSAAGGGFTLTELLITATVIVISATVVVPYMSDSDSSVAIAGARTLAADLQYAQDNAIATQKDVYVSFDANNEWYVLYNESGALIHPITNNAYITDFAGDRELSRLDIVSAFGAIRWVSFDPTGAPSHGGTVLLRAGDNEYNVTVSAVTGTVDVTCND